MTRIILLLSLMCLAFAAQAQYAETFSTPNKGYLINLADDFSSVNWSLSAWDQAAGNRDAADYFNTSAAGALECIDLDQEVCWESPLLNTAPAPTVSAHVDLSWAGFDSDVMANNCSTDYIRVQYSVNGGAYEMVPNAAGGNACATVSYPFEDPGMSYSGSVTVNQNGIAGGSTLKIKVCVFTNANAESVTIDNVSVPEPGVTVVGGVGVTDISGKREIKLYPNPARESVQIKVTEASSGIIRVRSVTGQIMTEMPVSINSLQINVAKWPAGMYFLECQDAGRIWATEHFLVH